MSYFSYPPTTSGGGVPIYANIGSFPPGTTPGQLGVAADTGILYEWNGSAWVPIGGPGTVLSVGTFDSGVPSPNGAHIDSNALIMQSASAANPGEVNTGTQTFAGNKTFNGMISAANLTGQNSGDTAVVFRPGGVQGGLVYNNWTDLYAAIVTLDVARVTVTFDNSLAPCNIPAGTYSLPNVYFEAILGISLVTPVQVTLEDACIFTAFPGISNLITLVSVSTSPVFIPSANYLIGIQFTGNIVSVSGAPMIEVPAGLTLFVVLLSDSSISGQAGFPLISLVGNASLLILLAEAASLGDNTIGGGATSSLTVIVENPNVNLSSNQTDFTGTTSVTYPALATNMTFGSNLGDLVYADASGKGTVLPADTSNIKKFLSEHSILGNPQAPVWSTIASTDMPAFTGDVTTTAGSTVTHLVATSNSTLTTISSLVSVGTITTGTWNATTIAINHGGTGQVTAAAAFAALSPLTTAGDIIYEAAGPTPARLPIGSTGNVLTVSGGLPVWSPPATSGTVTSVNVSGGTTGLTTSGGPITSSGTITLAGTLIVANGGTGLTSGTSGGILGFTSTTTLASSALLTTDQLVVGGGAGATPKILAAGTANQYLKMNATPIPAWFTIAATTVQRFTSGTATYTTPANVVWILIEMVGGGGGGGGGGVGAGASNGTAGTASTWSVHLGAAIVTCNGGGKGGGGGTAGSDAGGSVTTNAPAVVLASITGQTGNGGPNVPTGSISASGQGGVTAFGGAGGGVSGASTGGAASANSGSGGGGGGTGSSAGNQGGGGGSAGGYCRFLLTSPSASYDYSIGSAGSGGAGNGTGGSTGGAGSAGIIIITEFYV